jgi:subtilisin family serine protease
VKSVTTTGERRYRTTSTPYYTADPYFQGFAPDAEVLPYAEGASTPGQWDMHAIGLEHAFGYSQSGATVAANSLALGSSSVKIAIIDTGEDANHPELKSKIAYQKCFISNEAGITQSTGSFSTDEDGHGTDVSGIAAAAGGNNLGFVGAGGNTVIYAYRVFPTPDDNCTNDTTTDQQCSSDTYDIASAIDDAVAQHVNVISMSLGGGGCTGSGTDSDGTEGTAVANAIANNVIVVAAAGNSGGSPLSAPACDTGVIAAGATGLDDGQPTGTTGSYSSSRTSSASASNPVEYVASYSQYGTPAAALHSSSAWGIVAPGGDPTDGNDSDDLHWIENIWTTTPFVGSPGDESFLGECTSDFGTSSEADCRTLIAGTSMATPHVAGAVALILSVNSSYQSPTAMKALLCSTADDIGDSHEGCGRLNVYRAMAHALSDPSPP